MYTLHFRSVTLHLVPHDVERGGYRLGARELHGPAVVDRVGSDQKGQEAVVPPPHLDHAADAR